MAFDSTFIEIRHVDDGSLAQVIRGNNLRLLFADTQPSVMNSSMANSPMVSSSSSIRSGTSTLHSYSAHPPPPYGGYHAPYATQSPYGQYGAAVYGHAPHMAAYAHSHASQQRLRRAHERDEIILVSDDKVMAVRLAAPPPPPADAKT
jgi:hypothetical protein